MQYYVIIERCTWNTQTNPYDLSGRSFSYDSVIDSNFTKIMQFQTKQEALQFMKAHSENESNKEEDPMLVSSCHGYSYKYRLIEGTELKVQEETKIEEEVIKKKKIVHDFTIMD